MAYLFQIAVLLVALFQLSVATSNTVTPVYHLSHSSRSEHEGASCPGRGSNSSAWWLAKIQRNGTAPFLDSSNSSSTSTYKVFRNVKDFGAKGDGKTDDTEAINKAISQGPRCGEGCNSTTTTPALVYFPPGEYIVSKPVIAYYYSQLVGDAISPPTLKATKDFNGSAVIDADPYGANGNWYINQNSFFRQIRNFKIDLREMPMTSGVGIHWQVSQATSLQNIEFNMVESKSEKNAQQGIFQENGSGGFMSNMTFNGGRYGMDLGNQQFTIRDAKFNNVQTAINMAWDWSFTFAGLEINNCGVGLNISADGSISAVGSVLLIDSKMANTDVGILSLYHIDQKDTNGTLVMENVDMCDNVPIAVKDLTSNNTVLEGNKKVSYYVQGRVYNGADGGHAVQQELGDVTRPSALINPETGAIVTKNKPQYKNVPVGKFKSVKKYGAIGDGKTDDTVAIQKAFDSVKPDEVVYFDHGAYVITDTVMIPSTVRVVGEIWPLILAGGDTNFKDQANPKPVWSVGNAGGTGDFEMQDLVFATAGPQPGAILMEVNSVGEKQASNGLWDVHFRVGGTAGTDLQAEQCKAQTNPNITTQADPNCLGAFMLVHVAPTASVYMENTWLWVADHDLDTSPNDQVSIYNGRGILIESTQGAHLWGTAAEHNVLYNYQLANASNVFIGLAQTETAYMQGNPDATTPYVSNPKYFDPNFSECTGENCARTWGMRILNSAEVLLYGTGMYSFFDNYTQECVNTNDCQQNMISIECSNPVHMLGVNTKASVNMVTLDGKSAALDKDNRNTFGAVIAAFDV